MGLHRHQERGFQVANLRHVRPNEVRTYGYRAPSELRLVEAGSVRAETITPASVGLAEAPMQALAGGELADNQAILESVLQGRGTVAQRDVVALNTALVLWAAGHTDQVAEGLEPARRALASGTAWQRLEALRQALA